MGSDSQIVGQLNERMKFCFTFVSKNPSMRSIDKLSVLLWTKRDYAVRDLEPNFLLIAVLEPFYLPFLTHLKVTF